MLGLFGKRGPKKIVVFLGQEDKDTLCGFLADTYAEGARAAGHEVRRVNIGDLKFDPLLHKGYKVIQELEPDLKKLQEDIRWCDHFVLFYPTWWSSMPAIMKGLIDRMWIPGFAYHFNHNGMGWHGLLHGRSARVIITMDSWPIFSRFMFGDSTNEIGRAVLWFSGFRPVSILKVGPVKALTDAHKALWKEKIRNLGYRGR